MLKGFVFVFYDINNNNSKRLSIGFVFFFNYYGIETIVNILNINLIYNFI